MKKTKHTSKQFAELCKRAEALLDGQLEEIHNIPAEDIRKLIQELHIYQIELEMQNEELRRSQLELEDSHGQYLDLYDFAPVGYFTFDQNGLILEVNLTGADLLGIERRNLIKREFTNFVVPDFKSVFYDHCQQVFKTGVRQICELKLLKKDGASFWGELESEVVKDALDPIQIRTILTDITQRKKMKDELIKEKRFSESVINSLPGIFYLIDENLNILRWNKNLEEITGYSSAEIAKMNPLYFVNDAKRKFVADRIKEAFKSGQSSAEINLITKDGRKIPYHFNGFHMVVDDGSYLVGTGMDISERKRAEEDLRKERDMAQMYFNIAGVILLVINADQKVSLINKKGCQVLGYDCTAVALNEIIDKNWFDNYVPERMRENLKDMFISSIAGTDKLAKYVETPVLDRSGQERIIAWHNTLLQNDAGDVIGTLSSGIDVTDQRQIEQALWAAHHFLKITNRNEDMSSMLKEFVTEVKHFSGCSTVGLRVLDNKGNIPYQAYEGFCQSFYEIESPLSINTDHCMCVDIIKGVTNPELPYFTQGGSFYTNGTTRLLNTLAEEDKGKLRNKCNEFGFESVALIPIFKGEKIMGLIHLADPKPNMLPLKLVRMLENISMQLSTTMQRLQAKEDLQKAHDVLEERVKERTADLEKALTEVEQLKNRFQAENIYLQNEIRSVHNFDEIISKSNELKKVLAKVERVASTTTTVLILGETGTGKELIARAIHNLSPRKGRPLLKVNCAAIPENLIESDLFGHERGAFTGALTQKTGRFELAHQGTIFLDEIADLPLELQSKLLRVLQEGEFERLGNPKTFTVDVRIIAATNRSLEQAVEAGEFRQDLFYRLNVFPITIPPLRERKDDIPLLVSHFVKKYSKKLGKKIENIPLDVMATLQAYSWPGNIRELENVIERAVILTDGSILRVDEFFGITAGNQDQAGNLPSLKENERLVIQKALEESRWVIEGRHGAATKLGIAASTLRKKIKEYGFKRPHKQ
jgi:PAS domain S-box-containing protein